MSPKTDSIAMRKTKKKKLNNQRPRVDRFVAPRDSFPELRRRTSLGDSCERQADDIWSTKYIQRKKYIKYLDESFGLEPLKLYNLNSLQTSEKRFVQPWPCIPRKRSYLSSVDSILDLPNYSYASFPDLLDWSKENILVAALGSKYHKWSWRTQNVISKGYTRSEIQCCKFDPRGELLVLGTKWLIEIHDATSSKTINTTRCQCYRVDDATFCSITAIDWSPTGNSFVSGCLRGAITSFDRNGWIINSRKLVKKPIVLVQVSPNARHVAAITYNSNIVLLLAWPTLKPYMTLDGEMTVKSIAWHPWRSALLSIGGVMKDHSLRIGFWDTPSEKTRNPCVFRDHTNLDAMLFSHETGELVLSVFQCSLDRAIVNPKSRLVVMSDPNTVVDQCGDVKNGIDRVRTMVFSPDGTKLATATVEEDLLIWNFLPEDSINKKKMALQHTIPVFLDNATEGFSLR